VHVKTVVVGAAVVVVVVLTTTGLSELGLPQVASHPSLHNSISQAKKTSMFSGNLKANSGA